MRNPICRPYEKVHGNGNIIKAQKISMPTKITSITCIMY